MCDRVDKVDLLSEATAANMVELHRMSAPECTAINAYPCGDHFHIGHDSSTPEAKAAGAACKAAHRFTTPPQPGRRGRRRR